MANETLPRVKGSQVKDAVTVLIDGTAFEGWEVVSINKNLESIADSFSIGLHDKFEGLRQSWPLRPGVSVKVNIGSERVLTGRIEKVSVNYNEGDRAFDISGRSNTGDLVDCMHVGPYTYNNLTPEKLAEALVAPFGLKVFTSVTSEAIAKVSVKPNETIFETLDKVARLQGFFWTATRGGNIRLTEAAKFRASTSLEQDVNILSASGDYDDAKRFRDYIVKGQTKGVELESFGLTVSQPEGTAKDLGVRRNRPLILIAESNADAAQAKKRAQWEAASRLAKAIRVGVTVQGWTQETGELWGKNQVTQIKSEFLGLNRDMLITRVSHFKSNSGGTTTRLTLVDPQSYSKKPELNKKKKENIFDALGANFK